METAREEATIDLLGVLAYGELQAFERLSLDAVLSPDLAGREAVTEMAIGEYGHYKILVEGLRARGADSRCASIWPAVDGPRSATATVPSG